jgi:hypothetical protein
VRLAHLAPTSVLSETIGDQMTHLCLANLILEDREYLEFYSYQARRGAHVILDVPAFERIQMSTDDLLEAIRGLQPAQVILPDDMDDPAVSLIRMKEAARAIWDWKWGVDLLAVPHGRTVEEYLANAGECAEIRGVTTLGIQEEIEEDFGIYRGDMVRMMYDRYPHKRLHFNGWTDGFEELEDRNCQTLVSTADSAKLVVYGIHCLEPLPGMSETVWPGYPGRKSLAETSMGYFSWNPPSGDDPAACGVPDMYAAVRNNLRRWNAMANNGMVVD